MKRNVEAFIAISISFVIFITGCASKAHAIDNYKKKNYITVGTNAQFPPFEFYENEKIIGFDMEISQKIADKLGVKLEIKDMSFNSLIDSLEREQIDFICSSMSITESRRQKVNFSNPYYSSGQAVMVNNNSIVNISDLKNKKIGVQSGTTGELKAMEIEGAVISNYNTALAAIMDMKAGNIDAVIFDLEPSKKFVIGNSGITILDELITQEKYAVAVSKKNEQLLSIVNEVLAELKSNGEYDRLVEKYIDSQE